MDIHEVWARLASDEDAQETVMAAHRNGGRLSHSAAQELACGDSAFSTVQELGLIEPMRLDGSLNLTVQGKRVAQKLAEDLEDGHLRQLALDRAVLKVARVLKPGQRIGATDVVERMEPAKYGRPWDAQEVEESISGLLDDGLVNGLRSWQATILEGITRQGRARLSPVEQSQSGRAANVFNDHSLTIGGDNLGNAATGDHVAQTSTVTVNSLASGALQHLLDHVDDLPSAVQENVADQIKAAHAELIQATPDTAKAARWLDRASETLDTVTGSPKVANFLAVLQLVSGVLLSS